MAVSFPQLEVYYIDFSVEDQEKLEKRKEIEDGLLSAANALARAPAPRWGFSRYGVILALLSVCASLTPGILRALKRLVNENRFFVITTQQTLDAFENACGNEWITNTKALKQKQYYIRHPKKANRNLLIESKSFYDYIEEEQKDELIDYILSHCPAKHIKIDRIDLINTNGKASAKVKAVDSHGTLESGVSKKDIYNYKNPNGNRMESTHNQYVWLNNSIMRSISALSEGGSLTQTYESDFTFGLSVGEAKTIGLDLSKHKKFTYSIHVEC